LTDCPSADVALTSWTSVLRYLQSTPAFVALSGVFALTAFTGWPREVFAQKDQKTEGPSSSSDAAAGDRERAERLDFMKRAAAEYTFYLEVGSRAPLRLHPEPVLRWTNPVRGTTDGAVFIWTLNGRPEVAVGIYKWYSARLPASQDPDGTFFVRKFALTPAGELLEVRP
jgi:hypothetical protein